MVELVTFAVVGILATVTHYVVALTSVEVIGLNVFIANFVAYCVAAGVSYFGHSVFTFKAAVSTGNALRFFVVSIGALLLSQLVLAVLEWLDWFGHRLNFLVVVFVVPAYSYLLNKFWVYK